MLTADLVRARVIKGQVRPSYLDPADAAHRALAGQLIALVAEHVGRTRGELDEAIADHIGEGTDFALHRGLARLLFQRAVFEVDAPCDPAELRRRVFERAAQSHPVATIAGDPVHPVTRGDVLAAVASDLGITPAQADRALYADLDRSHALRSFEPIAPEALLHRYNVALAQAVLLRAHTLRVTIGPGDPARYRQLFRYIKFYRLMHSARGDRATGYEITLDGPMSLFQLSSKYGLQMAEFLPALLLCSDWSLDAELQWGKQKRALTFQLRPEAGLVSHYPDRGVYITEEERFFVERFAKSDTPWELERKPEIIDLGGRGVLIPDLVLRHRLDGREAWLEIVGFWRRAYLEARMSLLQQFAPPNLILAVSSRLRGTDEALESLPSQVVFFKDVILTREVIERAEQVAIRPEPGTKSATGKRSHPRARRSKPAVS